MLSCKLVVMIR